MAAINMHDAKTHFSRIVARVEAGEEVVIARAGKPVVKIVAIDSVPAPAKRRLGMLNGLHPVPDDIKTPFAAEIEEMFYGNTDKFA